MNEDVFKKNWKTAPIIFDEKEEILEALRGLKLNKPPGSYNIDLIAESLRYMGTQHEGDKRYHSQIFND